MFFAWPQQPPASKTEKAIIERVKTALVSSLDSSLPKVSLEYFLKNEGGNIPIRWEVNDCGEVSGDQVTDSQRDLPMCVEAAMDLKNRCLVSVFIAAGTFKKEMSGPPTVFSITVTEPSELVRRLRHLGDLPAELHRPPPRFPRDLPNSGSERTMTGGRGVWES